MFAFKPVAVGLTAISLLAGPALADVQTVTLHNETDKTIVGITIDEYGDRGTLEVLEGDTLEPGESTTVDIGMDEDAEGDDQGHDCVGDIHAQFEDGSTDTLDDVNICDDHDISFS